MSCSGNNSVNPNERFANAFYAALVTLLQHAFVKCLYHLLNAAFVVVTALSNVPGIVTRAFCSRRLYCTTAILISFLTLLDCAATRKPTTSASAPVPPAINAASATTQFSLTVQPSLQAKFWTADVPIHNDTQGTNIRFTNLSTSTLRYPIVAWTWAFGDGTHCDQTTCTREYGTTHYYKHGIGIITVTLTVTDDHNNVAQTSGIMTP